MKRIALAQVVLAALLLGACGGDDPAVDASTAPDAPPPRGTISMTWRIERAGAEVSCGDAQARFVDIEMTRQGEGAGEPDVLNCTAGGATTRRVDIGTYDLRFDLLDAGGDSLLAEPLRQMGVEVDENVDTPLGVVLFAID